MGAGVNAGDSRRNGPRFRPRAEINVTPFVDVMLVLLIVFMVSAPLLAIGENIDLPDTDSPAMKTSSHPLTVTIDASGTHYLQDDTPVAADALAERLIAIRDAREQAGQAMDVVVIRADENAPYGAVLKVLADLRAAGLDAGLQAEAAE